MLRPMLAYEPQENCNSDSQDQSERHEIPQSRKAKDKDQNAAHRKERPYEVSSDREFVHADAGMAIFGHNATFLTLQ